MDEGSGGPFVWIAGVVTDENHYVYVADEVNATISVYDERGQYIHSIGRKGEGPREFAQPVALQILEPDTLIVFDAQLWRVSTFLTSGELVSTYAPVAQARFGQIHEVQIDHRGGIYVLSYHKYQPSLEDRLGGRRSGVVRGTNTIQSWDGPARRWVDMWDVHGLDVFVDLDQGQIQDVPFGRRYLWRATEGGIWEADSEVYAFTRRTLAGGEACRISVTIEEVPVTEAEREAYYEVADLRTDSRFRERLPRLRSMRQRVPVPSVKPALNTFVLSRQGTLWVQPTASTSRTMGDTDWHVLSPTGTPVAIAYLPASFVPMYVDHWRVVGRQVDSLGVQRVAVFDVR